MHYLPYANLVGSLMYDMVCMGPDIAYAMSVVRRFMFNHGRAYCQDLKWILLYLKRSLGRVLVYGRARQSDEDVLIEGFVDSNFAGCLNTRNLSLTMYLMVRVLP